MGSAPKWIRNWAGGRVRLGRNGEEVFVLRQTVSGKTLTKTLDAKTEQEALKEFRRFEDDPEWYFRDRDDTVPRLTEESLEEFLAYKQSKDGGRVSAEHLENVLHHFLTEWMSLFGDRDLRQFRPIDADRWLKKPVNGKPKRSIVKRVTSLKSCPARHHMSS